MFSFQGIFPKYKIAIRKSGCDFEEVGVDWGVGPPVPIPNTEVKHTLADNTCRVTGREDR